MGLLKDSLADLIRDSIHDAEATREDWEGAIEQVFGRSNDEPHVVGGQAGVVTFRDGLTFTPDVQSDNIGYRIDHPDGRTEYLVLHPSQGDPENAEPHATFLYQLDAERAAEWHADNEGPGTGGLQDFASWSSYYEHFTH